MDFTPPSNFQQPTPISSIPPSRKLPIKRKTPTSTSTSNLILTTPKLESTTAFSDDDDDAVAESDHDLIPRHTPFKFHRIWTEPDEIRLLRGLIDCSSQGLSFPRDLGISYARFSDEMSQPYSKSQLSDKLRRLRKKFRVIASRISKGLDETLLSPQDRALYDLSKQLWEPDSNCKPTDNHNCKSILDGIKLNFPPSMAVLALPSVIKQTNNRDNSNKTHNFNSTAGGLKREFNRTATVDMNVKEEQNGEIVRNKVRVNNGVGDLSSEVVQIATKTLADVVDRSLKEIKTMIDLQHYSNLEKEISFEKRWRDQHIAEFDVFAKRLKLIMEHSSLDSK